MSKKKNTSPETASKKSKVFAIIIAVILFVTVSSVIFITGSPGKKENNKENKNTTQTGSQTAEEYDREARIMLEPLAIEMAGDVSPYKFILPGIQKVEELTWNALDIDSTMTSCWARLGYIYAQVHGKQSVLRYKSFLKSGKTEEVKEEEKNILLNFAKANLYYDKALEFGAEDPGDIYYQKAAAAGLQGVEQDVVSNMKLAIKANPENRKYYAKIVETYMNAGDFRLALKHNEYYMEKFPDSDIPYLNLGGYHYFHGDTATAMGYYQQAADMGTRPEAGKMLHRYYMQHGYPERAEYYLQKAYEAQRTYDPERY